MDRKDRKGGPLWEQGWEETSGYKPGRRGHKIFTSKALSIVWVNLPSGAAPLALEAVMVFSSEPAHFTLSLPGICASCFSLAAMWDFQGILSAW